MYAIPIRSIWGSSPARLCLTQLRKAGSKQPGSSCGYAGNAGRHAHSLVPLRSTRYSPPWVDGQSRMVAFLVMNAGPARNASATFSESVVGNLLAATWCLTVCAAALRKAPKVSARMIRTSFRLGHRDRSLIRLSFICSSSMRFFAERRAFLASINAFIQLTQQMHARCRLMLHCSHVKYDETG